MSGSLLPPAFSSRASALLHRIQRGSSAVELVYTSHDRWPFPSNDSNHIPPKPVLRISVLDSSFNPPTLAHLALANTQPPLYSEYSVSSSVLPELSARDYDAKLLLLSVRNADKLLNRGDASYIQRLEMIYLLAGHISHPNSEGSTSPSEVANVAIAIIDEPTFVGKSTTLLTFLHSRMSGISLSSSAKPSALNDTAIALPSISSTVPKPQLTFLLGFDTLVRLLSPRFYASEEAMTRLLHAFFATESDDSRVVCARRLSSGVDREAQEELESRTFTFVKEFIGKDHVALIDINKDVRTFSSSEVRNKSSGGDLDWKNLVPNSVAEYIVKEGLYPQLSDQ